MTKKIFLSFTCLSLWILISGIHFSLKSFLFAFFATTIPLYISRKLQIVPSSFRFKIAKTFNFALWLAKEIFMSSWQVSKIVWRKYLFITPELKVIKSKQKTDLGVVIYANSITITPGTVTISNEGKNLLVHTLDVAFKEDLEKGVMDDKIQEMMRLN